MSPTSEEKSSDIHDSKLNEPLVLHKESVEEAEEIEVPSGHDLAVLKAVGGTSNNNNLASLDDESETVSFQGIRRKLGLHQETLSRALRRLEREGLIQKINHDYKISRKGEQIIFSTSSLTKGHGSHVENSEVVLPEVYAIPILRTVIPADSDPSEIERSLSHRWFGSLRWYGSSKTEGSTILSWITEDGRIKLIARLSDGYLSIESEATTKDAMTQAVSAAYEIFDHISSSLKKRARNPNVAPFSFKKGASMSGPSSFYQVA